MRVVVVVLVTPQLPVMELAELEAVEPVPWFLQPMRLLTPVAVVEVLVVTGPAIPMVETVAPVLSYCLGVPLLR
jgi:hypothetical protein